jgi:uncharacterized protein
MSGPQGAPGPADPPSPQKGLHVLVKPIGPICNLACRYCFYLSKEALYPSEESWRMSDATLEAYVRQYLDAQPAAVETVDFAFQGGEPTLMGLDYFRRVVELEQKYLPPGRRIQNSLQTNGILLDDAWCEFLKAHGFLVGLSIDGPADLHDAYRRDKGGAATFSRVMRAVDCLRKHAVPFNALSCIHRKNADQGARVYGFLRDLGVEFIQFIPVVQRLAEVPPGHTRPEALVSAESVLPEQFGRFLSAVFEMWVRRDVGRIFVRDFDQALAAWLGVGASLCVYAKHCGRAVALEHNGDLYSCDHFVEPAYRLGNIHETPIGQLAESPRQAQFGRDKEATLPEECRRCDVLFICNGGCPKDRFIPTRDGQAGSNYLCGGYRAFFRRIDPVMRAMAAEVQAGREAAVVMRRLRAAEQRARQGDGVAPARVGRNDPCP